jgi:hypothetical protein
LFDNRFGDHGGSYEHGHHIFFWMPDEKRFDHLKVCLWKGSGPRECERFKIRRVDAASFRPWGIEIRTARHFAMSRDPWYMRFVHAGRFISPRVGFHWR